MNYIVYKIPACHQECLSAH